MRYFITVLVSLLIAVPITILITRQTAADGRGSIILNVDQEGPAHVKQYISLLRQARMLTESDTTNGSLYIMLDKADIMKAFNNHNSNKTKRDSLVGFIIHFGFYGDTLNPSKGQLIPYIRPLLSDVKVSGFFMMRMFTSIYPTVVRRVATLGCHARFLENAIDLFGSKCL
jgi:hypothetical protein